MDVSRSAVRPGEAARVRAMNPIIDVSIVTYLRPPYMDEPRTRMPIPPDFAAVRSTDIVTSMSDSNTSLSHAGLALILVNGRDKIEMPKLISAITIQNCGWPGRKYTVTAADANQISAR